jgi:predicted nucleic acid-binding Zn ribbon protein
LEGGTTAQQKEERHWTYQQQTHLESACPTVSLHALALIWTPIASVSIMAGILHGDKGMPTFDYQCPNCGHTQECSIPLDELGFRAIYCGMCSVRPQMDRLPAAPNFTIKGFNAKNGYSK